MTRIGLALGGGGARGWAHIGVIRALERAGIRPAVIAGTSAGALVGGCRAAGRLGALEAIARTMTVPGLLMTYADPKLKHSGTLAGQRIVAQLRSQLGEIHIEDLPLGFAAVATDLNSGREVVLSSGSLIDAIRASISVPGLFNPVPHDGMLLADGGLVNPVPVSAALAQGADVVIAVDLFAEYRRPSGAERKRGGMFGRRSQNGPGPINALVMSVTIMLREITRARLREHPPAMLITPSLGEYTVTDFHLGSELIELGEEAAQEAIPDLVAALG